MAEYRGCQLPEDLYYDLDYVWLRPSDDGLITIGVTDPAQTMGGRMLAAHIKKVGAAIRSGRHVATLESGKWVGGVPVPFAATVAEHNKDLLAAPHLVNVDPYGAGWVARLRPEDPERALAGLMTGEPAVVALKQWIDRYDVECMRCME